MKKTIKGIISGLLKIFQIGLFCLFLITGLNGQEVEKLYITVSPYTAVMKINGDTIALKKENQPYVLELKKGTYPVELWAPGYEIIRDTLTIKETASNIYANKYANKYAKALTVKTPEFKAFEELNIIYNKEVKSRKRKKRALIAVNALLTYYIIDGDRFRIKKQERIANDAYKNYLISTRLSDLEEEFERYGNAQRKHNDIVKFAKTKLIVGIPVLLGAYVGTWFQIKKINKKPLPVKPMFSPKNPFLGSTIKLGAESYGGNYKVGLKITF